MLSEGNGNSARTFAASTRKAVTTPEKDAAPQDEFDRLEELQKQANAMREAWRNLLANLGKLSTDEPGKPETEKPNT